MEPIAIVGMGCLFPGAQSPNEYWQNLLNKVDSSSSLSEDELGGIDPELYFDAKKGTPDKICYTKNGHVRGFQFDPAGYRIPAEQLQRLDKLFQWTLYVAHEALRDAGFHQGQEKTGMVLGNIGMPTHSGKQIMNSFYHKVLEPYIQDLIGDNSFRFQNYWNTESLSPLNLSTASQNALVAGQALGLDGPCFTLDAACSSAIYAIKVAADYLNSHKVDVMLAGSVCHADHIYIDHGFNVLQAFPEIGHESIPFDRHSDGLKAGEGAGIVTLMRLKDAVSQGRQILGVIESIGLSNDAGAKHILVPDFNGQVLALDRAYGASDPGIDYLECHATGTPVGDQVELNSIEHYFFGEDKTVTPRLGANKGNIGHMLTASGMASLLKVLLAMQNDTIPGTIQLEQMVATKQGELTIKDVVRDAIPWPKHGLNKRAGINAFGFGGVNGHLVLHEHDAKSEQVASHPEQELIKDPHNVAITGMAVAMADTYRLSEFNAAVHEGQQKFSDLPATRWSGLQDRTDLLQEFGLSAIPTGAYIEKFEFDCKRFKLPPNVAGIHLLSHMSLMQLAATAYHDAGYTVGDQGRNIAVIVAGDNDYTCYRYQARNEAAWQVRDSLAKSGIDLSPEQISKLETVVKDSLFPEPYAEGITGGIGNVVASRISANLHLNGPAFTVCSQENSVFRALELAEFMLSLDQVEAVIVGSGSFCGGLENVLFTHAQHPVNLGKASLSFEKDSNGWNLGEGGGVVVLQRQDNAKRLDKRIYANIRAIEFGRESRKSEKRDIKPEPCGAEVAKVASQCLQKSDLSPQSIGLVEAHASGFMEEDHAEASGLAEVYGKAHGNTVITSVKSSYGHLGAAAGMASLIKTALCLYHRYLPGTPGWQQAKQTLTWDGIDILQQTKPWKLPAHQQRRYAAINGLGMDQTYAHLILEEPDDSNQKAGFVEFDENELRKNSLIKTVYVGGEVSIPDMIVNEYNRALFTQDGGSKQSGNTDPKMSTVTEIGVDSGLVPLPVNGQSGTFALGSVVRTAATDWQQMTMQQRQLARNARTHLCYLRAEQQFYRHMTRHLDQMVPQVATRIATSSVTVAYVKPETLTPVSNSVKKANPNTQQVAPISASQRPAILPATGRRLAETIFDEAQLTEMTDGKVANVLGQDYAEADAYAIRTRMPSPPYMFVSRVTRLTAEKGRLEPCVIEWEYDLQPDDWFVYHGLVPAFVSLESSHAMIIAFTKIGCDQMFKGELRYRAIDSQTNVFSAMPKAGETLRGRVDIKSFIRVGKNVLISYDFDCFVGERHAFRLTANSGFFPLDSIQKSKGVKTDKIFSAAKPQLTDFAPLLSCTKSKFSEQDVEAVQSGNLAACFGPDYGETVVPGLYAPAAKMLDRIISVDPKGGPWQLGAITGETDIDPSHWVFKSHFKNDPVLPGTFIVEGCEQVLKFYLYYLGLHSQTHLRPTLIDNHHYSAKFRGEVKCAAEKLQYRLTVKQIDAKYGTDSKAHKLEEVTLICIAEIIYHDNVIGICDNLGARFVSEGNLSVI